ncbi:MAG: methyltransferase domain-containing protein [Rhodobacteraceae bacterium]|nr:methyltransferase domain-containing protein [Paracoccaceae bacterium]
MTFADDQLTQDDFLGGAIKIWQPKNGYRAATDPVFLAAAVVAKSGQSVLEIGCGAGTALACLCKRVPGLDAHGLEIQADYADLARRNAADNGFKYAVHDGDLLDLPEPIRATAFDHVFINPPFYDALASSAPSDSGRDTAHRIGEARLEDWIIVGLRRLKPRGYFTIIHRAERLADILGALNGKTGDIRILPLTSREGRMAGRVIVRARKGVGGALELLAPLILHQGLAHSTDEDSFRTGVRKILRNIQPIVM